MKNLMFDEINHRYSIDGVEVPSVTQVLNSCGIPDFSAIPKDTLEQAQERGKAIHFATEIFDHGESENYDLDEMCKRCIDQWQFFKTTIFNKHQIADSDMVIIEKPFYSEKLRFAGTPDRVYVSFSKAIAIVVDIKTGLTAEQAPLQTAGYEMLVRENMEINLKKVFRYSVHLFYDKDSGSMIRHEKKTDENIFLSCLNVYKYKKGQI